MKSISISSSLETSLSIADQQAIELTLPEAAKRGMGVVIKRPIANAAWRSGSKPADAYAQPYWERLQALNYDFLRGDLSESISTALRFTLSVPGVHTAIVGTAKPERWVENAKLLAAGAGLGGDQGALGTSCRPRLGRIAVTQAPPHKKVNRKCFGWPFFSYNFHIPPL